MLPSSQENSITKLIFEKKEKKREMQDNPKQTPPTITWLLQIQNYSVTKSNYCTYCMVRSQLIADCSERERGREQVWASLRERVPKQQNLSQSHLFGFSCALWVCLVWNLCIVNGFLHSFLASLPSSSLVTSKPCKTPPELVLDP